MLEKTNHFCCCFLLTGNNYLVYNYTQEPYVPFVIDAVYAMAHALHNMYKEKCGALKRVANSKTVLCEEMDPPDGTTLLEHIRRVNFTSKKISLLLMVVLVYN